MLLLHAPERRRDTVDETWVLSADLRAGLNQGDEAYTDQRRGDWIKHFRMASFLFLTDFIVLRTG